MKKIIAITVALLVSGSTFGQSVDETSNGITGIESLLIGMIFSLAFLAQIFGLSFFLPKFLVKKTKDAGKNFTISESLVSKYTTMNYAIVGIGLPVLALLLFHPFFTSTIPTLLVIGIYFLLQLFPIIFYKQLIKFPKIHLHINDSFSLSEVIHPLVIGFAVLLFLSYLIMSLISWDGSFSTQILQIGIFIGINAYLALMLMRNVRKVKKVSKEEKLKHLGNLVKTAPFFVYLSIGISLYYFGKMLLFGFELNEYRPIMMSIALLLLGLLIFKQMSINSLGEKKGIK